MQDKQKFLIIGLIVLVLVVAVVFSIIPRESTAPKDFSLKEIILAKGATESRQPVDPTGFFMTDDKKMFAVMIYGFIPAGTKIEYQWYDLKNNSVLYSETFDLAGDASGNSVSSIEKEGGVNWGKGLYEFRVLKNGTMVASKEFAVKTPLDLEKEQYGASLKSVEMAKKVDLTGKISGSSTNVFSTDDKKIYASITYGRLPSTVSMEAKWKYLKDDFVITTYEKSISEGGAFAIYLDADADSWIPTRKWPKGQYQLEIYFDGDLQKIVHFDVK